MLADTFFHRNFDVEIEEEAEARKRRQESLDPVFNARQLDEARRIAAEEAFEKGRVSGHAAALEEARNEIAARHAEAVDRLVSEVSNLNASRADHEARLERDMTDFVRDVCARVFPELVETFGASRVAEEVGNIVRRAIGSPYLEIRVAPQTLGAVREALEAADRDGRDTAQVHADEALSASEVRAVWKDGRSHYAFDAICEKILMLLANESEKHEPGTGQH